MPELLAIEPISRNIGIAVSSQLAANTNGVSRSTLIATLKLRKIQKPINATPPSATPIGTRKPISTRIETTLISEARAVLMSVPELRRTAATDVGEITRSKTP